ncbi:MAG: hypothetical protein IPK13_12300 [Deltaproteobacteria bacterium]|nr:hypothetical protein [Deltaproteobacteria bacterium]
MMRAMLSDPRLHEDELFELIEVRPPYFAIEDICRLQDGTLVATVPVEQALGDEDAAISSAEAGRHLAILGSCAAALANPERTKHFYLAYEANFKWRNHQPTNPEHVGDGRLVGYCGRAQINGRIATATTWLETKQGERLCELEVAYKVLSSGAFEAIFSAHEKELRRQRRSSSLILAPDLQAAKDRRRNPYAAEPPLTDVEIEGDRLSASLGVVQAEQCMGHFPRFPALPVAILAYDLIRSATTLCRARRGYDRLRVRLDEASLRADNLPFAGMPLGVRAEFLGQEVVDQPDGPNALRELYRCEALSGAVPIGAINLSLFVAT